ncbi:MAG TPA: hypothetical protein VFS00_35105, partial [Polyangiaceae bacterium]|nr:hypothetical protein [Polyangiaceae bacterium]
MAEPRKLRRTRRVAALTLVLGLGACRAALGIDDLDLETADAGKGGQGGGRAGASGASGGTGGAKMGGGGAGGTAVAGSGGG